LLSLLMKRALSHSYSLAFSASEALSAQRHRSSRWFRSTEKSDIKRVLTRSQVPRSSVPYEQLKDPKLVIPKRSRDIPIPNVVPHFKALPPPTSPEHYTPSFPADHQYRQWFTYTMVQAVENLPPVQAGPKVIKASYKPHTSGFFPAGFSNGDFNCDTGNAEPDVIVVKESCSPVKNEVNVPKEKLCAGDADHLTQHLV
jgi:hypothetical protein